jgi:hypothetical protein
MKIYILGDSFADNLFKNEINAIINGEKREGPISKYINLLKNENLPDPMHFGDYLKLWGHEVINLGIGGCSNESIFHQFTQIKEPFDRLIVNWTGLSRFDWYLENSEVRTFTGGINLGFKATTEDELLIPTLVMKFTPRAMQVLFLGALLSALLSTTSGAILAPASVLGENILKPLMRRPSDKIVLLFIRVSVVLVTLACIIMAIQRQNIFELVGEASAFSLVSLFIPLNAGLWWKKTTPWGSHLSMILGLAFWGYFHFISPSEIPAVWYGLLAGMIGLLLGNLIKAKSV